MEPLSWNINADKDFQVGEVGVGWDGGGVHGEALPDGSGQWGPAMIAPSQSVIQFPGQVVAYIISMDS